MTTLRLRLYVELKQRLAEQERLNSKQGRVAEEIRSTERRIALLKELLELEGVEIRELAT